MPSRGTFITPIEVCETRYGVLVDQYALDMTEGGAGRFRGSRGLVRDYGVIGNEAWFTSTFGRHKYLPWGMQGGAPGSCNAIKILFANGRESEVFGKTARFHLKKGDVARLITGSDGGYGDPYDRPVEEVVEDVRNGYVTLEMAKEQYGVILDPQTFKVIELTSGRFIPCHFYKT